MCRAALESPRKSIIFEPYPSVVDPTDPKTLAFNPKVQLLGNKLGLRNRAAERVEYYRLSQVLHKRLA